MERIESQLIGIGQLLNSKQFSVPPYQRPYAWTDEQVDDLLKDLSDAITKNSPEYFFGTLVITKPIKDRQTIIDGQQRLVTMSLILASIRDYFASLKTAEGIKRSSLISGQYLSSTDLKTLSEMPRLVLISADNDFYRKRVIADVGSADRKTEPTSASQRRLTKAIELVSKHVKALVSTTQTPTDRLSDWVDYIRERAKVICVEVSDEENAYVIFEVLNDRGLELSIADLLKNYLFRIAGSRVAEAQSSWVEMTTLITETGQEKDVKAFIRHLWSSKYGVTREKELYNEIKKTITTEQGSVDFAKELAERAAFYSALANPGADIWKPFGSIVGESIEALDVLNAVQLRPLLIAILSKLGKGEVQKALPMVVAWHVRFLIAGKVGTGTLETYYADRAKDIVAGKISTAAQLWTEMKAVVPANDVFEAEFAKATVSKHELARFYLRVLEHQSKAKTGELIVNPSEAAVTLEHILPQTQGNGWGHFNADQHKAYLKRIGNMALLDKKLNNNHAGNADFESKKSVFAKSSISLTNELAQVASNWTGADIDARQARLAKIAVKAWRPDPHT